MTDFFRKKCDAFLIAPLALAVTGVFVLGGGILYSSGSDNAAKAKKYSGKVTEITSQISESMTPALNEEGNVSSDRENQADQDTLPASGDTSLTDVTAYGDVVRQYEEQYGTLQFYENEYSTKYTGVFLLKTVDFDGNGVEELMIGYSVPHPSGIEYCAWPALDVWTLDNGKPVCLYEEAMVTQSDIGRHCLYTTLDDVTYLVTGWSGSDMDLDLLSLKDGTFSTGLKLRSEEQMSGAYVTGMKYYLDENEIDQTVFDDYYNRIYSDKTAYYGGSIYQDSPYTAEELEADLQEMKGKIFPEG